jgi:hypothetical protein
MAPFLRRGILYNQLQTGQVVLTLYSTLAIKLGAEHPPPEDQHHQGKDYPNTKADAPDRG